MKPAIICLGAMLRALTEHDSSSYTKSKHITLECWGARQATAQAYAEREVMETYEVET